MFRAPVVAPISVSIIQIEKGRRQSVILKKLQWRVNEGRWCRAWLGGGMAWKPVAGMGLEPRISHVFTARNILSAKDALCRTELELMELLDLPMDVVKLSIRCISERVCPPCNTVLELIKKYSNDIDFGHLITQLDALDDALCGGIPCGVVTEIVGPAGIGKTQLCLMLTVLATSQNICGGRNASVIYFDTEHKFNAGRMVEIAQSRFPDIYCNDEMVHMLAAHVLVYHSESLSEFTESLKGIEETITVHGVKLIIIDSIAVLLQSENAWGDISLRQDLLGHQASVLKSLAHAFKIPVVVTNQVRTGAFGKNSEATFSFEVKRDSGNFFDEEEAGIQLRTALGTSWAHSVNIRLILESSAGKRFIRIAKSPISPVISFPYHITSAGLALIGTGFADNASNELMMVSTCAGGEIFWDDFEQ